MNERGRRQFVLGSVLFGIEWLFFAGLCWLVRVEWDEIILFSAIYFFILLFFKHYHFTPMLIWQEIINMLRAHLMYGVISFMISCYLKEFHIIKLSIVGVIMYCVTILVGRGFRILTLKKNGIQLLILGLGRSAEAFDELMAHNRFMYVKPMAYVDLYPLTGEKRTEKKHILDLSITLDELPAFLICNDIDEAFIVDESLSQKDIKKIISYLHNLVPVVRYKPVLKVVQPYNTEVSDFDGNMFISVTDAKKKNIEIIMKKLIDLIAGIVGCICLIPLTLFVKIRSIQYGEKESIFFKQERIGKDGNKIQIYKYRSMVPNAEQLLEELMEQDPKVKEEYLLNKKLDPDPRITPFGAFLRKSSLDEMPQFINVLKGEMSLIGPRPYLMREKKDMGTDYETIVKSKPGITGMWQANGRSDVSFEKRCKLDVYYYNNWSIWLDVIIIVKTIKAVLKHDGAV